MSKSAKSYLNHFINLLHYVHKKLAKGGDHVNIHLDLIQDKIEFFEATNIKELEKKIQEQIEHNQQILLEVHSVSHQMHVSEDGKRFYSAVVHFKAKKS